MWKEIYVSTEKNRRSFWQVGWFKCKFFSLTLFFFTVKWTQIAGFVIVLNPPSSPHGISCGLHFHNLWRAWNHQLWLFIICYFSLFTITIELQFLQRVSLYHKQISLREGSRSKPVVEKKKFKDNDIVYFSSWRCFLAKCLWYPHLEARQISVSFYFNYTEIEELRLDIKSYHGLKVKLKFFMH